VLISQLKADGFGFTGLQVNAVKVGKLLDGPFDPRLGETNVKLDDFIALEMARIGQIKCNRDFAARLQRIIADPNILVLKRGIAEAVAELNRPFPS
jgi:hypothetical protein